MNAKEVIFCGVLCITIIQIKAAPKCDFKSIFKTPNDGPRTNYDALEILERSNFDEGCIEHNQNLAPSSMVASYDPKAYANAQVFLRIGADTNASENNKEVEIDSRFPYLGLPQPSCPMPYPYGPQMYPYNFPMYMPPYMPPQYTYPNYFFNPLASLNFATTTPSDSSPQITTPNDLVIPVTQDIKLNGDEIVVAQDESLPQAVTYPQGPSYPQGTTYPYDNSQSTTYPYDNSISDTTLGNTIYVQETSPSVGLDPNYSTTALQELTTPYTTPYTTMSNPLTTPMTYTTTITQEPPFKIHFIPIPDINNLPQIAEEFQRSLVPIVISSPNEAEQLLQKMVLEYPIFNKDASIPKQDVIRVSSEGCANCPCLSCSQDSPGEKYKFSSDIDALNVINGSPVTQTTLLDNIFPTMLHEIIAAKKNKGCQSFKRFLDYQKSAPLTNVVEYKPSFLSNDFLRVAPSVKSVLGQDLDLGVENSKTCGNVCPYCTAYRGELLEKVLM